MKTYAVTIKATIIKTIEVEADDADKAANEAHELFTVECDGDETYMQDTLDIEEV